MATKEKPVKEKRTIRIIGERNICLHLSNPNHRDRIIRVGKALSSSTRLQILDMLKTTPHSLQEIASILEIPLSSAALHIKTLEDAQLIVTETQPGIRGSMRVCICSMQSFHLETFDADIDSENKTISLEMPIGNYSNCEIHPTCGLADENGAIEAYDTIQSFYTPARTHAQLIWFSKGYIEYRFPNIYNPLLPLGEISFSMEICSEAPGFLENWPSDITISINNVEVGTFHSPGDFGTRRGKLTPPIWPNGNTQYGFLKTFSVRERGSYLDGKPENPLIGLSDLDLERYPYISLKIAVKEDAGNVGGINIFGEKYGDYPQGIIMNLSYL